MSTGSYYTLALVIVRIGLTAILWFLLLSFVIGLVNFIRSRPTGNKINNIFSVRFIMLNNLLLISIIFEAIYFASGCFVTIENIGYPDPIKWFLIFIVGVLPIAFVILNFIMYITYRSPGIKRSSLFLLSYSLLLSEIIIPASSNENYLLLTIYIIQLLFFMLLINTVYSIINSKGAYKSTVCKGLSMFPTLKPNNICFIRIKGVKLDYSVGDIIEYIPSIRIQMTTEHIIHRIIRKERNRIITRGDNNMQDDAPIKETDIVGKAIASVDPKNYIISSLTSDDSEIKNFSTLYLNENNRIINGLPLNNLYFTKLIPYLLTIALIGILYII